MFKKHKSKKKHLINTNSTRPSVILKRSTLEPISIKNRKIYIKENSQLSLDKRRKIAFLKYQKSQAYLESSIILSKKRSDIRDEIREKERIDRAKRLRDISVSNHNLNTFLENPEEVRGINQLRDNLRNNGFLPEVLREEEIDPETLDQITSNYNSVFLNTLTYNHVTQQPEVHRPLENPMHMASVLLTNTSIISSETGQPIIIPDELAKSED